MAEVHATESSGFSRNATTQGKRPNLIDLSIALSRTAAWRIPLPETAPPRGNLGAITATRSIAARTSRTRVQEHAMSSSSRSRVLRKIASRRQKSAQFIERESPFAASLRAPFSPQHPASGAPSLGKRVLTPREIEVLRLVAHGESDRRIAERLYLSRRTVSCHVSNILDKLNVESRRKAVLTGMRIGLL